MFNILRNLQTDFHSKGSSSPPYPHQHLLLFVPLMINHSDWGGTIQMESQGSFDLHLTKRMLSQQEYHTSSSPYPTSGGLGSTVSENISVTNIFPLPVNSYEFSTDKVSTEVK
jgi:hypothetical protein